MDKAERKDFGKPDEVRESPKARLELIKIGGDEEHVLASIEVDATGFLLKDSLPEEFIDLIKELRPAGSPISPNIARQPLKTANGRALAPPADLCELSARESETLSL